MAKTIVALLLVGLFLFGGTQVALATDTAVSGGGNPCFLDLLPEDARRQAETILSELHAKIAALREQIAGYRGTADREKMAEIHEERWEVKSEAREQIAPLLPEEHQERFMNKEYERKRHYQPNERPSKGGWRANRT